jgi:hypothetical protein
MGGNAIKDAKRVPKEEYVQLCHELQELFPELKMKPVKAYRQKPDFGDIDIVVETSPTLDIPELVLERMGPDLTHYHNNMFFSFEYKGVQVDFISMSPDIFIPALNYFAWNDLGNFIGRTARSVGFKYGHEGLMYELRLGDHYKKAITVSTDTKKILKFLGHDYERWAAGFDVESEIFEYAASSTMFNSLYFDLDEQGHNDRVRNRKRKMYQKMLAYIEDNKIEPKPKKTAEERREIYDQARLTFGDAFHVIVLSETVKYEKGLKFKEVYNGDIVSGITGLKGKDLGEFMSGLKKHIEVFDADGWDRFIDDCLEDEYYATDTIGEHIDRTFVAKDLVLSPEEKQSILDELYDYTLIYGTSSQSAGLDIAIHKAGEKLYRYIYHYYTKNGSIEELTYR